MVSDDTLTWSLLPDDPLLTIQTPQLHVVHACIHVVHMYNVYTCTCCTHACGVPIHHPLTRRVASMEPVRTRHLSEEEGQSARTHVTAAEWPRRVCSLHPVYRKTCPPRHLGYTHSMHSPPTTYRTLFIISHSARGSGYPDRACANAVLSGHCNQFVGISY